MFINNLNQGLQGVNLKGMPVHFPLFLDLRHYVSKDTDEEYMHLLLPSPTSLNDLGDHVEVLVSLLKLGCSDPNVAVCWNVLTSFVQHL